MCSRIKGPLLSSYEKSVEQGFSALLSYLRLLKLFAVWRRVRNANPAGMVSIVWVLECAVFS